jgi:hydrogenase maturation protease
VKKRILIAGIGNIFLGDDAFGGEVVRHLSNMPDSVLVKDFGIRGFDLAYALMDGYETAILVDATPRGGTPGTLYLIEPDRTQLQNAAVGTDSFEAHGLNPVNALTLVCALGGQFNRVLVLGCEPEPNVGEDCERMGLSPAVEAAVPEAVKMIDSLIRKLLAESPGTIEAVATQGAATEIPERRTHERPA